MSSDPKPPDVRAFVIVPTDQVPLPVVVDVDVDVDTKAVLGTILEFAKTIPPEGLTPTLEPGASVLINTDPFAFSLGISIDRGMKADIIWTIPYWIKQDLGHLDVHRMAKMTEDDIRGMFKRLPKQPRYMRDVPRTILELCALVVNDYGGDASLIWRDADGEPLGAAEVKATFMSIYGVGDGIANMGLILLERCWGIRFPDWSIMDVKPDVHVQRVLFRLGVAASMGDKVAVVAAQSLNPSYPGALDAPLWVIGREWCRPSSPDCGACCMVTVCPKVDVVS